MTTLDQVEGERIQQYARDLSYQSSKANTAVGKCIILKFDGVQWPQLPSPIFPMFVDISGAIIMDANDNRLSVSSQLRKQFREYADKWYKEIMGDSSISRMTSTSNYLSVIKLGEAVVPLILKELQKRPAPWFLALRVLTGETEVGRGYPGNFQKIAEAWISWGTSRGLI